MADVGERWTRGRSDSEEGTEDLQQLDSLLRCCRCNSEDSELTQFSTEASSPGRHVYQSLTDEEGGKVTDWVLALRQVETTLEEEIEAFSIKESRCRQRECTLVSPLASPLMRRRANCCQPLTLT